MARRTLSMQGRIVAAGVSIAIGGALVGVMAAGDHTADATSTSSSTNSSSPGTGATPSDRNSFPPSGDFGGSSSGSAGNGSSGSSGSDSGSTSFPRPQTRTGGS